MRHWSPDQDTQEWAGANRKPAAKVAKRKQKAPLVVPALIVFFLGLGFLLWAVLDRIPGWGYAVGLVLIVVAIIVDRRHYVCGDCGNRIEKTSVMCPACRATIVKR